MSRHVIETLARQDVEVVVGWDQPLQTYFGVVYDKAKKGTDNDLLLWVGTQHCELYEIDQLAHAMREYVTLEPQMRAKLYGDKDSDRVREFGQ